MPNYLFKSPNTGEVKEVFQKMLEPHVFELNGVKWERVWTNPQAAFNSQISATDPKSFIAKTKTKNCNLGQLWDISQELSEKREGMSGQDEVRAKAEEAYKIKTGGKRHPHAKKQDIFHI